MSGSLDVDQIRLWGKGRILNERIHMEGEWGQQMIASAHILTSGGRPKTPPNAVNPFNIHVSLDALVSGEVGA